MVGLWPWCGIAAEPADGDAGRKTKPLSAEQRKILERFASEFVEITPGQGRFPKSFDMGSKAGPSSERPAHEVTFERPFAIAKYEVTQELYQAVMGKNPSVWQGPGRERNSCEMMTWQEANAFCRQVTTLMREADLLKDGELLRLPTEAEWEYCCRAGTDTDYSFGHEARGPGDAGDKASLLDAYAWHTGNAAGNDPSVGVLKPNAWGLYDMHGYLWEYVLDAWHDNYDEAPSDGSAAGADMKHVRRVIRGGSWRDRWSVLRSRTRWAIPDHVRSDAIGFRCVKSR
ncbi:MAG: formylglycine-generating enzyme family protein [Planctomycetes bacterium]|nr:formylglycine-generating enzyme family protein [Planctomycetota bacterium]